VNSDASSRIIALTGPTSDPTRLEIAGEDVEAGCNARYKRRMRDLEMRMVLPRRSRALPEPSVPVANGQRDQKGRFAPGHPKLGGRRPAREKARTLTPEAGRRPASQSQDTPADVAVHDEKGRFVLGHRKLGGRRAGSRNKHGRKAALGELVTVATNSEAEGQDPRAAVIGAVVKGLQATPGKSLGYVKLMLKHGIGREKIDNGPASNPDRRWLGFGKKTIRSPRAPRTAAARHERKGRELVVRDGDEEFAMVKDQATTCRNCPGRGFRYWGLDGIRLPRPRLAAWRSQKWARRARR
jgi:hypothetical protein